MALPATLEDRRRLIVRGQAEAARLHHGSEIVLVASYVYPDGVILCNRVYDPGLLEELGRKRYSPR